MHEAGNQSRRELVKRKEVGAVGVSIVIIVMIATWWVNFILFYALWGRYSLPGGLEYAIYILLPIPIVYLSIRMLVEARATSAWSARATVATVVFVLSLTPLLIFIVGALF